VIELNAVETGTRLSCRAVERLICAIWGGYFGREVGPYDDFFELGGDSLAMIDVVGQARASGLSLRSSVALRNPTPARLAERLVLDGAGEPAGTPLPTLHASARHTAQLRGADWTPVESRSVPIVAGTGDPLYVVHSDSHAGAEREAVAGWAVDRPVRGFPLPGVRGLIPPGGPVEELAGQLVRALRAEQPGGPYRLAGFGTGAVLAFEMARQLRGHGAEPVLLALIGPAAAEAQTGRDRLLRRRLGLLARRFGCTGEETMEEIHARLREDGWYDDSVHPWDLPWLQLAWADLAVATHAYRPAGYPGPVLLCADGPGSPGWLRADPEVHRFDYGLASPLALLGDGHLALVMRKALAA
jgi:hypothetical protein